VALYHPKEGVSRRVTSCFLASTEPIF